MLNVMVIVTTFNSVAKNMAHGNYAMETTDLQLRTDFVDLGDVAMLYNSAITSAAVNTCAIMIRFTMLLSFFKSR
jgi:hypothetical protein